MKFNTVPVLRAAALVALALGANASRADWVISRDVEAVRPGPESMLIVPQNPPGITWSRHATATSSTWYLLVITPPSGGAAIKAAVGRNWYLPTKAFTAYGTYQWKVSPFTKTTAMDNAVTAARGRAITAGASPAEIEAAGNAALVALAEPVATVWSDSRTFVVNSSSAVFEVPDNNTLKRTVLNNPRARLLPANFTTYAKWSPQMVAERGNAVKRLIETVEYRMSMAPLNDADWPLPASPVTASLQAQNADIRNRISKLSHQLEASAMLFRLKSDTAVGARYLAEAIKRGNELAGLDPSGPTSYARQDQATRMVALALAKGVDLLYDQLDLATRQRWDAMVKARAGEIYADLAGPDGRIDQYPLDAHAGAALGYLALTAAICLGELPEADAWFNYAVRSYIHQVYPWSGMEGGYANGTAYGQAVSDVFLNTWDSLGEITGVNLYKKPWTEGFLRYMASFVPPGQTKHVFGDGHEDVPNTYLLKALASRVATPVGKWYYNTLVGMEDPLTQLMAPSPLPALTVERALAPAQATVFPSIGWVAMHSDPASADRTSLYFKSSPFGAYNHSHGDQNSIVLFSGGQQLLIESGYYDWYGSPLWSSWYRQTKAHNAITYNGGIGQPIDGNTINLTRNGKITAFSSTAALDFAEGDATPAYSGALTTAKRKIWYLRNENAAVVLDTMASSTAKSFEWNFHAPSNIVLPGDGSAKIVNGTKSVCLRSLNSNTKVEKRVGATPMAGVVEDHGAFVLPSATTSEFIILLDVGCRNPATRLTSTSTGRTLTVGTQTLVLPRP